MKLSKISICVRHDLPPHRLDAEIMATYRKLRDLVSVCAAEHRSVALKGKPKPPSTVAKIAAARRDQPGTPHTPESKAKLSAAHKGRRKSPAWRAKISKTMQRVCAERAQQ